jgi:cytochrome c551/c552
MFKTLKTALGLDPDASTDDDAVSAVEALVAGGKQLAALGADVRDALGLPPDAPGLACTGAIRAVREAEAEARGHAAELAALAVGATERAVTLEAELAASRAEAAQSTACEAVSRALLSGKITPAQQTWAMEYAGRDPEGFQLFASQAPASVPMKGPLAPEPPSRAARLTEAEALVNRLLGITPRSH